MSASVSWSDIEKMLDACAPGWTYHISKHSRVIKYNGMVYRNFPKQDFIELGHIRSMCRHFGILECAKRQLPNL
jgi:hypothetical protein